MTDPTIVCPHCQTEIKLTESLAAPLVTSLRQDYEQRLVQKDALIAQRETVLQQREQAIQQSHAELEQQIAERVQKERISIAAEEAGRAKLLSLEEIKAKDKEMADLQQLLEDRTAKLGEAQKVQADFLKQQRALEDAKRELDLTVEKQVQAGLATVREKAKQEVEEALKLKVSEKEHTISALQKQIDDLKRRAEQGSQQLQGEVQELELEALLKAKFPSDQIAPVPKGEFGGDAIQRVVNGFGQPCGTILWESKRTKAWSDGWLVKLREDQRNAKADIAIIVSQALPKGVETFSCVDGIWVVHPTVVEPVAFLLRQSLVDIAAANHAQVGQQTKMELVYRYLTGSQFKLRIQAIVEAFTSMKEDLDKEKKVITAQWAKRDKQIEHVVQATVGMYGDLQGIAGKSLQEIEGLSLLALGAGEVG